MTPLKNLSRLLPRLPHLSSATSAGIVAVDLTGEHVKLASGRESGGSLTIQGIRSKKFPENADEAISQYLAASYAEWRIRKKHAVLIITSKLFISKNIDMPSKDPEEIRKIVDLQAHRYTPYSRDEIIIDYLCNETPGQHYTNVLLMIMNRKVADRYSKILDRAGIEIDKILIAPEGMAATYQTVAGPEFQLEAVGGLHIGQDSSDLTIVDKKQVVFVRNISVGAQHWQANAIEAQAEFLKQLNKSIVAYQNQGVGQAVKILVLTSLVPELGAIEEAIKANIPYVYAGNIPVKLVRYETCFAMTEAAAKAVESERETSFFEIMACLAALPHLKVDLIPKEVKLKRRFREGGKDIIAVGMLIMTISLMVSLFLGSRIYLKRIQFSKIEDISKSTVEEARALEQVSTKSRFLRGLLEGRGRGLYAYEKLSSFLGTDIYLSEFRFEDPSAIHVAGTAESMSRVFSFVTGLEESNYFADVKTTETKSRREGQKDVADFQLECNLREK